MPSLLVLICNNNLFLANSNQSSDVAPCCSWTSEDEAIISSCNFWLEGVLIIAVGFPGLIGNALSIFVLAVKSDMAKTNVFHLLLVSYFNAIHKTALTSIHITGPLPGTLN